jgi:RHH-type proline utilization regulon transcriptional repressor/proline dehydrogenase/delta 1-pyrroline-5-carboxylate dehydrogenase
VLHVLRFRRDELSLLLDELKASGYALTGGVHSRIDGTIDLAIERLSAGNVYVNRNIIGAVVGVQPFGGHGLSGTGPKAGGPLYLKRLLASAPPTWPRLPPGKTAPAAIRLSEWLAGAGRAALSQRCASIAALSRLGSSVELVGPVGEQNLYSLRPRGTVLCHASSEAAAIVQVACALSAGNRALLSGPVAQGLHNSLPRGLRADISLADVETPVSAALTDCEGQALLDFSLEIAKRSGPIVSIFSLSAARLLAGEYWPLDWLLNEHAVTINTTAAGGNASLMSIG